MKSCLNLYFAPYKTCNLNCRYCYVPTYNKKSNAVHDQQVLAAFNDLLAKIEKEDYRIGSFCLHGAEPALLIPKSVAAIAHAVTKHWERAGIKKQGIAIQSNGTLFDHTYLTTLQSELSSDAEVRLGFSIDPPKVVHDEFRQNSFDLVESNYQLALELGFPVSVLSVITGKTLNHLQGFKAWIDSQLERQEKTGNPYRVKIKLATGKYAVTDEKMKTFIEFLIANNYQKLIQILSPGYCLQAGNECEWYEFDVDGNCYACNKTFNDSGIFASWRHESLDVIVEKRRRLFSNEHQHSECRSCEFQFLCNSGCPTDRHKSGPMTGKAHECEIIKAVMKDLEQKRIHLTDFYNYN
ncbi:MAG: radical SAM protein [Proteobacteria bacterium]|nr:radical SAM protein [Pseudomonadota bacterium]